MVRGPEIPQEKSKNNLTIWFPKQQARSVPKFVPRILEESYTLFEKNIIKPWVPSFTDQPGRRRTILPKYKYLKDKCMCKHNYIYKCVHIFCQPHRLLVTSGRLWNLAICKVPRGQRVMDFPTSPKLVRTCSTRTTEHAEMEQSTTTSEGKAENIPCPSDMSTHPVTEMLHVHVYVYIYTFVLCDPVSNNNDPTRTTTGICYENKYCVVLPTTSSWCFELPESYDTSWHQCRSSTTIQPH